MDADLLLVALGAWETRQPSTIGDHGRQCCKTARVWFEAADVGMRSQGAAPDWLIQWKSWGPSRWPAHWCEVATMRYWDCGILASLAQYLITRDKHRAHPVQLVQTATEAEIHSWRNLWRLAGVSDDWICDPFVYHEAVAVEINDSLVRIWDPLVNLWLHPFERVSQSPNVAVRVRRAPDAASHPEPTWDELRLLWNEWVALSGPLDRGKG